MLRIFKLNPLDAIPPSVLYEWYSNKNKLLTSTSLFLSIDKFYLNYLRNQVDVLEVKKCNKTSSKFKLRSYFFHVLTNKMASARALSVTNLSYGRWYFVVEHCWRSYTVVPTRYNWHGGLGLKSGLGLGLRLGLGLELTLILNLNLTLIPTYPSPDPDPNPPSQVYFLATAHTIQVVLTPVLMIFINCTCFLFR